MRYAVISDIHGNLPAFTAVIADAQRLRADRFLLLGDYYEDLPYPNEVCDVMRRLENAVCIRGNKEDYLIGLAQQDPSKWTDKQLGLLYWNYRELTPENREYLTTLPSKLDIENDIHLEHSSDIFFRTPRIELFQSQHFRHAMKSFPFTHDEYLRQARETLLAHSEAMADVRALPKGVYLFGHNHSQFFIEIDGRLFVNPGSCGMPCDCEPGAAYTMLELADGAWSVTERRVEYDIGAAVTALHASSLARENQLWARVLERELLTGEDIFSQFLSHLWTVAAKHGENTMPVSNAVWESAAETWD